MTISLDEPSVLAGEDMRRKDSAKEQRRLEREARESEQREPRRARLKHDHAPRRPRTREGKNECKDDYASHDFVEERDVGPWERVPS